MQQDVLLITTKPQTEVTSFLVNQGYPVDARGMSDLNRTCPASYDKYDWLKPMNY